MGVGFGVGFGVGPAVGAGVEVGPGVGPVIGAGVTTTTAGPGLPGWWAPGLAVPPDTTAPGSVGVGVATFARFGRLEGDGVEALKKTLTAMTAATTR